MLLFIIKVVLFISLCQCVVESINMCQSTERVTPKIYTAAKSYVPLGVGFNDIYTCQNRYGNYQMQHDYLRFNNCSYSKPRGCRGGRRKIKNIKTICTKQTNVIVNKVTTGVNHKNNIKIKTKNNVCSKSKFGLLNARSVNKRF